MKTYTPSGSVRSNYPQIEEMCRLYRNERAEYVPKSKLPDPKEVGLRMELAMFKADLSRAGWLREQAVAKAKARIAEIEATWPQLRVANP